MFNKSFLFHFKEPYYQIPYFSDSQLDGIFAQLIEDMTLYRSLADIKQILETITSDMIILETDRLVLSMRGGSIVIENNMGDTLDAEHEDYLYLTPTFLHSTVTQLITMADFKIPCIQVRVDEDYRNVHIDPYAYYVPPVRYPCSLFGIRILKSLTAGKSCIANAREHTAIACSIEYIIPGRVLITDSMVTHIRMAFKYDAYDLLPYGLTGFAYEQGLFNLIYIQELGESDRNLSWDCRKALCERWNELLPYIDKYVYLDINWERQTFDMELADAWTGQGGIIVMDRPKD